MRMINKNKRSCYYANPTGETETVVNGIYTGERTTAYSTPTQLMVNYSANIGEASVEVFGNTTDYDRTMVFSESCPLMVGSKVWIGKAITDPANYVVTKVADSLNYFAVALKELK